MQDLHPMQHQSEHIQLYERLQQVSEQLLAWSETVVWEDHVFERGNELQLEFNQLKERIQAMEEKLLRGDVPLSTLPYADQLLIIARRIDKLQKKSAQIMNDRMSMLQKSMKGMQESKHLMRAYGDSDRNPIAYFFDEKK